MVDPIKIFTKINGIVSTVLNILLIYFILFKSTKEIKKYKWFLMNNTLWDMLFNILVSFLYDPEPLLADLAGALIVTSNFKKYRYQYARWICLATVGTLVGSCAAVCACFVFRYFCLQSATRFNTFLSIKILGPLCIIYVGIIVTTLILTDKSIVDPNTKFKEFNPNIENEVFIAFDIKENKMLIIAVLWAGFGVGTMTSINITCSFLITRKLKSIKIQLSQQTYRMHKQLVMALILQTLGPIIALIIPFSSMVLSSVIGIDLPFGPYWFIFISTLNAIFNPLFTIYFVKAYWHQIFPKKPETEIFPTNTTPFPVQVSSSNQRTMRSISR